MSDIPTSCGSCGAARIWHVAPMLERAFLADVEAGGAVGLAPLETYVCEGCGFTEWFTRRSITRDTPIVGAIWLDPGRSDHHCPRCKGNALCVVPMLELDGEDHAVPWPQSEEGGQLTCMVCADCGRLDWFASLRTGGWPSARCTSCGTGTEERGAVEHGGVRLTRYPVAYIDGQEVGDFQLGVCAGCGHVDWAATGVDRPRSDGHCTIELVNGERAPKRGPGGGPYR